MDSTTVIDITVVMCTYNGARHLPEQLESILAQTYPIREIIVQDDGSTDGTMEVLRSFANRDRRIKVFVNEGRHGINGNFFSALARASTDYIAVSDQDDIWEPCKLERQARAIGDRWLCSAFSVPFSDDGFPVKVDMRVPNTHLVRQTYICELPGHSMLFRREILSYIADGQELPLYYDGLILDVAAARESIVFLPEALVRFRRHADAATASRPLATSLLSSGALEYVWTSLRHHCELQELVRRRFRVVMGLLDSLPFDTRSLAMARRMGRLQLKRGPWAFCQRFWWFTTHSRYLFHTEVTNPVVRMLRAMFFVFSCGYYYRGQLAKHHAGN